MYRTGLLNFIIHDFFYVVKFEAVAGICKPNFRTKIACFSIQIIPYVFALLATHIEISFVRSESVVLSQTVYRFIIRY
jgi:hypothetical protein